MRPGTVMRQIIAAPILSTYIMPNSYVLDLGGYDGAISSTLKSGDSKVAVLDLDLRGLAIAQARGLSVVCASASETPFRGGSFDAVLTFDLLPSIPLALEELIVPEITRVLKSEGYLILTVVDCKFSLPFVDQIRVDKVWKSRSGISYERLKYLINSGGMEIFEYHQFYSWFTRFFYTVFYYLNVPRRGTRLKRQIWRLVIAAEKWWCPLPKAHLIIARNRSRA